MESCKTDTLLNRYQLDKSIALCEFVPMTSRMERLQNVPPSIGYSPPERAKRVGGKCESLKCGSSNHHEHSLVDLHIHLDKTLHEPLAVR